MSFVSTSAHTTSTVPAGFGVPAFQPGHSQRHQERQHPVGNGWLCQAKWVGVIILSTLWTLSPVGWYSYTTGLTRERLFISWDMWDLYITQHYLGCPLFFINLYIQPKGFTESPLCARSSDGHWRYFCLSSSSSQSNTLDMKYVITKRSLV